MTDAERKNEAEKQLNLIKYLLDVNCPLEIAQARWLVREAEAAQRCRDLADHLDQWERMPVETVRKKLRASLDKTNDPTA